MHVRNIHIQQRVTNTHPEIVSRDIKYNYEKHIDTIELNNAVKEY